LDAYGATGTLQIDCLATTPLAGDERLQPRPHAPVRHPQPRVRAWSDDVEGSVGRALETYVCHGALSPDVSQVADLAASPAPTSAARRWRRRVGLSGQAQRRSGRPVPAAGSAAAPAAPGDLANFYMTDRDADGAELVDMSVRKRKGAVVSLRMYGWKSSRSTSASAISLEAVRSRVRLRRPPRSARP